MRSLTKHHCSGGSRKNIGGGAGPSSFGRQPRLSEIINYYKFSSLVTWCGTVQCTFYCSLLRGITCFIMTNEVIIRCQKTSEVKTYICIHVYGVYHYPRTPIYPYPQYTPGTNQKLGGLGKIWGAVPPGPSLKPPLHHCYITVTYSFHHCVIFM